MGQTQQQARRFSYTAVDLNDSYTPPSVGGLADNPTQYTYDGDRQLTKVTRPDGNLLLARYDMNTGLLDSLTQARGKTTFSYLGTGQLASVTSPDGISLRYGYDGPVLRSESWGGLRGAGSVDSVSALVNIAFKPWVETVNDASHVYFGYDRDGLLDTLTVNSTMELLTHREGDGLLSNTSIGGVTSEVSYDNHGEPWKLHYAWTGGSFEQVLTRDSLGRIVSIAESGFGNHSYDYHYDAAGRLDSVAVDSVKRAGYTYDANGNRMAWRGPTSADSASATYDAQDRMLRYGNRAYAYTAAGELVRRTSGPTDTLRTTYDVLGNLTGARAPSGDSLRYLVDGANRRVTRTRNGHERTSWLYAGGIFIAAEMDSTGAVRNRYAYGARGHVPDLMVQGGVTYRLITDQLGSVRAAVNVNTGAVAQRIDYDAWGVITYDSAATFQSLGYTGGLEDRMTGLVRFGARDYEAGVGRWTAKDPAGLRAGTNMYVYVHNASISHSDASGLGIARYYSHRYNCKQTMEFLRWARQDASRHGGWFEAFMNHAVPGNLDFANREAGATFELPDGRVLAADQFGNYMAGYAGYFAGGAFGGELVIAGGWWFDLFGDVNAGRPFNDDADSQPDIYDGFEWAAEERASGGDCGCH